MPVDTGWAEFGWVRSSDGAGVGFAANAAGHLRAGPKRQSHKNRVPVSRLSPGPAIDPVRVSDSHDRQPRSGLWPVPLRPGRQHRQPLRQPQRRHHPLRDAVAPRGLGLQHSLTGNTRLPALAGRCRAGDEEIKRLQRLAISLRFDGLYRCPRPSIGRPEMAMRRLFAVCPPPRLGGGRCDPWHPFCGPMNHLKDRGSED